MKRIRCPKCDNYIVFDETKFEVGSQLVFQCAECGKQFAIRLPSNPADKREENEVAGETHFIGALHVIENRFQKAQTLPLAMGDNTVGKYAKSNDVCCPIESCDPSLDLHHCVVSVSHDKNGELKYTLRDGPSYTGTFVDNDILGDRERRVISHGTLFTLGATSVILHTHEE